MFFEVDAIFPRNKPFDQEIQSESMFDGNILRANDLFLATIYFHSNSMDVEKELFLWSILTGKQELALLFWARGKNKICK